MSQAEQPEPLACNALKYAEPYWIQDIRIAQRAIERQRLRQRDSDSVPIDDVDAEE